MWVLGLPLAMPVFVLSFFGGFIPYIGSLLTTGLAFLIAVAVGDTVDIVIMAIWTLVFNIVQGNVVAPLVYNRTTHIHPAIVLAGIPARLSRGRHPGHVPRGPGARRRVTTWRTVLAVLGGDAAGTRAGRGSARAGRRARVGLTRTVGRQSLARCSGAWLVVREPGSLCR